MSYELTNADWLAAKAFATVIKPPRKVEYLPWAINNIEFSKRESEHYGPYSEEKFCYFSEILRSLGPDDPCRIVTLMGSAQIGKTVLANIFTLGSMDMDPCDFLYVHPTEGNAAKWSKTKLKPMLKSTTALTSAFPDKSRDGASSVLFKERKDGRGAIMIAGANSPSSLSMVSMDRQVQDDLSKWQDTTAGDPEYLADSRSGGKEFAKIFKISTPLITPGCRITDNFKAGTQEYLHVPCPHCDEYQKLTWENFQNTIDPEHPERAHFTCIHCGCAIENRHRFEMVKKGKWIAENPKAKTYHRSFYLWVAYGILRTWEYIARRYSEAKGKPAREQVFMNDIIGLAYRADDQAIDWEVLRDRAEETGHQRGIIPAGALALSLGIDVNGDWLEWQLVGWGPNDRCWTIDTGVIDAQSYPVTGKDRPDTIVCAISEPWVRKALDELIVRTWPNEWGRRIAPDIVAIDGNYDTVNVFEWVKRHPQSKVLMMRGSRYETDPIFSIVKREKNVRTGKVRRYGKRFATVNVSIMKLNLMRALRKTDPEEHGYVALAKGLPDTFFEGLVSETRTARTNKDGYTRYVWVQDKSVRNEPLDTMNIARYAALRFGVFEDKFNWEALAADREQPPSQAQLDLEDIIGPPPSTNRADVKTIEHITEDETTDADDDLLALNRIYQ